MKVTNGTPTLTARIAQTELGMAYPTRVAWSRTPHSSRKLGKPTTGRRGSSRKRARVLPLIKEGRGGIDKFHQNGGMRNAGHQRLSGTSS
jgi:hypothetical protein